MIDEVGEKNITKNLVLQLFVLQLGQPAVCGNMRWTTASFREVS